MGLVIAFNSSVFLYIVRPRNNRCILPKGEDFMINDDFLDLPSPIAVSGNNGSDLKKDCVKAAGVFRTWKNLLFLIMILCLLLVQTSFWLVKTGHIGIPEDANNAEQTSMPPSGPAGEITTTTTNEPQSLTIATFEITFEQLSPIIRLTNVILIFTSLLYSLTMYFGLGVSFKVRLGDLGYISKAMYLSLIIFVLLLPWQIFFGPVALGAIYTPQELVSWSKADISSTVGMALLYLRFSGYWALVILLLLMAQLRSARWTKIVLMTPLKS